MFYATEFAGPAVHRFVDVLNAHVFTPVLKWPPVGQGVSRAAARLAAKRKANEQIPDTSCVTRQQRRYAERRGLPHLL